MAFRLAEAYVQFSQRGLSRVNSAARSIGGSFRSAVGVAGRFAGLLGTMGLGVGFGVAIKTIASFEQQMSAVKAVTGATEEQFKDLEATARQLGADTAFSASEAAAGMEFLARAGFNTDQIISAMPATLDLALSGALGLGDAADIASNALTGFQLGASESNRVADVLALTAASANTNVRQLGDGLKFVAPISAGLGVSIEDTSAAIGALSDAGLQGEMAGTGLRKILSGLADPSDTLKKKMNGLTLEGDGLIPVLKAISENGLSTAEGMAEFGERGGPAIGVLTSSVPKIEALSGQLDNAEGTAARLAETMSDNLTGSSKQAVSAFQELTLIAGDSGLKDAAKESVEALTEIFRSDDMKVFAEDIGILTVETGENIGIMSDKFFEALDSIGISFSGTSDTISDTWETFKFFSRNFGDIWDIATEQTSIGIQNMIERVTTFGTNVMEVGSWMVENWRSIFVDMLNAQSTVLLNIGANLKEFMIQVKNWLSGDGFNFEVVGLLDGFERTSPELPPLTQPVIVEGSEELDRLLDRVGQAEVEHQEEQKQRDEERAERKKKLAEKEVEEEEKKEKKKQTLNQETEDEKKKADKETKELIGDADAIFNATREAIAEANSAKTEEQNKAKTEKEDSVKTEKEDSVKTEFPEPVNVEVEQPDKVSVEVDPPEPVSVEVEQPDKVSVEVDPPEPVSVEVDPPEPVSVEVDPPEPVSVEVRQPDKVSVEVDPPEPVSVEVRQPDKVSVEVEKPEPVNVEVDQPDKVSVEVEKPEPVNVEVDQPDKVSVEVRLNKAEIRDELDKLARRRQFIKQSGNSREFIKAELDRIRDEDRELRRQLRDPLESPDTPKFAAEDSDNPFASPTGELADRSGDSAKVFNEMQNWKDQTDKARKGFQKPDTPNKTRQINQQADRFQKVKNELTGTSSEATAKLTDKVDTSKIEAHLKTGLEVQRGFVDGIEKVEAAIVKIGKKKGNVWS